MSVPPTLLVTGGAGDVATILRPQLREHWTLRLVDVQPPADPPVTNEEVMVGDLLSHDVTEAAVDGVDAVLHLAGNPSPRAGWPALEPLNVRMTEQLLAAASGARVPRFVFGSSIHAAGTYVGDGAVPVDPAWSPRPCCLYGASKVAAEALGWVYAETTDIGVICLRIGVSVAEPDRPFALAAWVSPSDLAQLVLRSLASERRYGVYFALSANSRTLWRIDNARHDLGYQPADNAEEYVHKIGPAPEKLSRCFGSGGIRLPMAPSEGESGGGADD